MINIKKIERISSKDIAYRVRYAIVLEGSHGDIQTEVTLETNVFGSKDMHFDTNLEESIQKELIEELGKLDKEMKLP